MFPNSDDGLMDPANYRNRVLKSPAGALDLPKLTSKSSVSPWLQGTKHRFHEGHPSARAALARRHHRKRVRAGTPGERAADGRHGLRHAHRLNSDAACGVDDSHALLVPNRKTGTKSGWVLPLSC